MNELNSIERHSNLNEISLSDQTKFSLNEINKIKDCFSSEIQERKQLVKSLVNTLLLLIILTRL